MGAFAAYEWQIAYRYLRRRRQEGFISLISWISFLGITLGVATLIIVLAVMNGFRSDLLERILGVGGHGVVYPNESSFPDEENLKMRLQEIDGVLYVAPILDGQVMMSTHNNARGMWLRGMNVKDIKSFPILADNIKQGSWDKLEEGEIAIGARLADRYGLKKGQSVTLLSPRGISTPFGVMPRLDNFTIGAIFDLGLSEYDLNFIFMGLSQSIVFLEEAGASALEFHTNAPDEIDKLRPAIYEALKGEGIFRSWEENYSSLAGALRVERNVMFLILTLILLVASLNIAAGLVMLVKDKTRDIAMLSAMGLSPRAVMRVFFITGASLGVAGTLAGLGLGTLFCLNIETIRQFITSLTGSELFPSDVYFLEELPAKMEWQEVSTIIAMALGLSFLSTLYPAWQAAKKEPAKGLRYE